MRNQIEKKNFKTKKNTFCLRYFFPYSSLLLLECLELNMQTTKYGTNSISI